MNLRQRFSFLIKIFLFLAICLTGSSVFSFYSLIYQQNEKTEPTTILIEKGDSLDRIARRLKKDHLIKSVSVFKLAGRIGGNAGNLKAGEYRIPAKASPKLILDILISGQTVVRRLTIPEGLTSKQTVDMLMDTAALFGEITDIPPNGTLLPETYVFSYGTPRKVVFDRMREGMNKTLDELWPTRNPDLPYTTKQEALVMASIVERETSLSSERARIAGVFVNRLRKGMRLQTDPTVIYAVTNGSMELKRALTYSDLKKDHPFNTYTRKGLPPSPICNPGRESIAAALNPQKTNELYFVADGFGGHAFASTFEGHRANIASWKKNKRMRRRAQRKTVLAKEQNVPKTVKSSAPVSAVNDIPEESLEQTSEDLIMLQETLLEEETLEKPVEPETWRTLSETKQETPVTLPSVDKKAESKTPVKAEMTKKTPQKQKASTSAKKSKNAKNGKKKTSLKKTSSKKKIVTKKTKAK